MKVLKARLYDMKLNEQTAKFVPRKLIVKRGDRSDKIRTYNFPQNRVTDQIDLPYITFQIYQGDLNELVEKQA